MAGALLLWSSALTPISVSGFLLLILLRIHDIPVGTDSLLLCVGPRDQIQITRLLSTEPSCWPLNNKFLKFILHTLVFFLCVCLYKGVGFPGAGVIDSCELPCGCWEMSSGPLNSNF